MDIDIAHLQSLSGFIPGRLFIAHRMRSDSCGVSSAPSFPPASPGLPFAPEGELPKRHRIQFVRIIIFVIGNLTDGPRENENMPGKAEDRKSTRLNSSH